ALTGCMGRRVAPQLCGLAWSGFCIGRGLVAFSADSRDRTGGVVVLDAFGCSLSIRSRDRDTKMAYVADYSWMDRLLCRMSFRGIEIQKSLADIEDRILGNEAVWKPAQKPVFITGLPRAGTTLLLEILAKSGFATHSYRSMPFVLCPLLWNLVSRSF